MKIATEVAVQASSDKIWNTLIDFDAYPEWNRVLKAVRGPLTPDSILDVDLQWYGKPAAAKMPCVVTGLIPPKYLSWVWKHKFGSWFLAFEHVFRIKERENGKVIFFQELYYTGMGLKFRRRDIEHMVRLSLDKLNDDLKHRVEPAGTSE